MMKFIFYFTGIIFAIIQMYKLANLKSWLKRLVEQSKWSKENKGKGKNIIEHAPDSVSTTFLHMTLIGILSILWMFAGLLTFNWEFFLIYLISILLVVTLNIGGRSDKFTTWKLIHWGFWKIIAIIFYFFVALNSYHLHIQLGLKKYIMGLF